MSEFSDVSKFLARFDGGARPNRYKVEFTGTPTAVGKASSNFTFLCRAASIPASILSPCVVAYMGREVKVPGDRIFDDWSVTVYNTRGKDRSSPRYYFEEWSDKMLENYGNVTAQEEEFYYMSSATVTQLDRGENPINVYDVKGIFPISVGEIGLAYDNNNTVEEFTVTFAVNYWVSKAAPEATAGGD